MLSLAEMIERTAKQRRGKLANSLSKSQGGGHAPSDSDLHSSMLKSGPPPAVETKLGLGLLGCMIGTNRSIQ